MDCDYMHRLLDSFDDVTITYSTSDFLHPTRTRTSKRSIEVLDEFDSLEKIVKKSLMAFDLFKNVFDIWSTYGTTEILSKILLLHLYL